MTTKTKRRALKDQCREKFHRSKSDVFCCVLDAGHDGFHAIHPGIVEILKETDTKVRSLRARLARARGSCRGAKP